MFVRLWTNNIIRWDWKFILVGDLDSNHIILFAYVSISYDGNQFDQIKLPMKEKEIQRHTAFYNFFVLLREEN